jgi:hypothetical protein
LVWIYLPVHQEAETLVISAEQLPVGLHQGVAGREIRLVYSDSMRIGDMGVVSLDILPSSLSLQANNNRPPAETVEGIARLEIPGSIIQPDGIASTSLIPGQAAHFLWQLIPKWPGEIKGQAWFYVKFYSNSGSEPVETTISAQPVNITVHNNFGLPLIQLKIISWAALLCGIFVTLGVFTIFRKPVT